MSWVILDGTDGRLFGMELGGGEISCWVSRARLDVTDGRLLGGELGGERYFAACVASDLTGRTADCLVERWVRERYRAG